MLTTRNLSGNILTASALQSLSHADLPHLQTLDLSACGLDETVMQCLAHAGWEHMECLQLEDNYNLGYLAAVYLTQANWSLDCILDTYSHLFPVCGRVA